MTDFVLILKYLRRFHIIQNASHMHLVKSNSIRGNVLKKKYFQTPNLYIYSTSRDRNHKGTYNALQFNSRLWRIKSRCQNTGEIRYSVKKFIPFQLDILIIGNTSNYNLVILDLFHQREHPTPPPPLFASCFKFFCDRKLRFETILKIYECISMYSLLREKNPSAFWSRKNINKCCIAIIPAPVQ